MAQINAIPSAFLLEKFALIEAELVGGRILDLACGNGRNGLHLVKAGHAVTFADRSEEQLQRVQAALVSLGSENAKDIREAANNSAVWQVDLEETGKAKLPKNEFELILVFNYLHRPLMVELIDAVVPGGYVIYQTFTTEQPRFGRPTNEDFLLRPGELNAVFSDWQQLSSFEGLRQIIDDGGRGETSACANIVVRKR